MRKTHTSNSVKNRYNKKTYDMISVRVRKEVAATFKDCLAKNGETISGVFHRAIHKYIEENEKNTPSG